MKSTIKIALGQNNEPVIKMMAVSTDDLRDQLCKQWYQKLGGESCYATVMFTDNCSARNPEYKGDSYSELIITPVPPEDLHPATTPDQDTNKLPSKYQIEDAVSTDSIYDGEVTAVRFTIGKVYYDILDKLSGKVIRDVDSCDIIQEVTKLPQAL